MSVFSDVAQVIQFMPNICIEYHPEEFVADRLLSEVPVPLYAGSYTKFSPDTAFQVWDDTMSATGRANEINWKSTLDSYVAAPYGNADYYDYDSAARNSVAVNWAMAKTEVLARNLKLNKELRAIALVNASTVVKSFTIGGNAWWTAGAGGVVTAYNTSAYPIKDVQTLRMSLAMPPNTIVMGQDVFVGLQNHPNVIGQRPVNRAGSVSITEMAELFNVKEIIVSELKYNTSGNRGRTQTLGYAWQGLFFMCYKNPTSIMTPDSITWATSFVVDNDEAPGPRASQTMAHERGWIVRAWEEPDRGPDGGLALATYHKYVLKVIASDLGVKLDMTSTS
jgi:hypothetical protein